MSIWRRKAMAVLVGAFAMTVASGTLASVDVDEEEVVFRYSGDAGTVYVTGDFNNWNPTIDRMITREGYSEIRLYLLPGRYRYRFVVDGVEIADPDNPWRDRDGNTFFIFRETGDGYEVVFEGSLESGVYVEKEEYLFGVDLYASLNEETGMVRLAPRLKAVIGEGLKADISASLGLEDR
ncbi:MAG TPA: hypothetical protein VLA34_15390, partial [Candidatus Krumholzibacterium sp.]|nr:hypothetical protein [Candidatus Krumholzibacterium sp.]